MEEFLKAILDLLDGQKSKTELLACAKTIYKLKSQAREQLLKMSEDDCDELSLEFGDKLFELLRSGK